LQPDVALEPLVDDWVHAYQGAADDIAAEKTAVHELVLFLIRACGLSPDVDEDEAVDLDGTGEAIDRIQEESVNVSCLWCVANRRTTPRRTLSSPPRSSSCVRSRTTSAVSSSTLSSRSSSRA
jgi:hypothetical protein